MRNFQIESIQKLKNNHSTLIIAPTGLGKTRAALEPHVSGRLENNTLLGARLIYSLPLRALTQGVKDELEGLISNNTINSRVAVHHGEEPESRIFSESACITTIDQYFTAFAGAPLSFAMNSGHAVAGAILTSYSVFDEVHLLSPEKGLPLLFAILKLRMRWGLISTVMTATLPNSVIEYFKNHLGLEKVEVSDQDIQERDSWRKVTINYEGKVSIDEMVALVQEKFATFKKIIVFINTVDRAIEFYRRLKDGKFDPEKLLLIHSRFATEHRKAKENKVRERFGKSSNWEGVLVTTQVAEAGMNISAPVVISELSPADSLIQRAGRCIRFKGNGEANGEFTIIKPSEEKPFLPYDKGLVERTEEELSAINGALLNWEEEKKFINSSLDDFYKFFVRGEKPGKQKENEGVDDGEEE